MANALFGELYSDVGVLQTPTLSGGDWAAALPLSRLQDRRVHRVARSDFATMEATRFRCDLGTDRAPRVLSLVGHNLSEAAQVRFTGASEDLLFAYHAGDDITAQGGVHTRADASTCASYRDSAGVLRYAVANVLRDGHYIGGVRHTLAEPTSTNLLTYSDDFDNAAWTKTRTSITSNAEVAPDGTTTADRLVEDATAALSHYTWRSGTIGAGATVTGSVFARAGTRTWVRLGVSGNAGADRFWVNVNLATGAVGSSNVSGAGTFTRARAEEWTSPAGGTYWRILVTGVVNGSSTTATLEVGLLAVADGSSAYDGDGTSYAVVWGAMLEAGHGSSYIPTVAATVTRAADVVEWDYDHAPQEMTALLDITDVGTFLDTGASKNLFNIGTSLGADPRFGMQLGASGAYQCYYDDGATWLFVGAGTPTFGQRAEMRAGLSFDSASVWRLTPGISINGGAETGTNAGTSGPSTAFAGAPDTELRLVPSAPVAYRALTIAAGVHTMAEMRAITYDSGWVDALPAGTTAEDREGYTTATTVIVPTTAPSMRYVGVQIDDTTNADTYVDIGRLVIAGGFQPAVNMSYGAGLGFDTDDARENTQGGATVYDARRVRRTFDGSLERMTEAEAFDEWQAIQMRHGRTRQLFVAYDPDDTTRLWKRSFLGVFRELNAIEHPFHAIHSGGFSIIEDL